MNYSDGMEERLRQVEVSAGRVESVLESLLKQQERGHEEHTEILAGMERHLNGLKRDLQKEINGYHEAMNQRVTRVELTVYGNSTPGLKAQVQSLQDTMAAWNKHKLAAWSALLGLIASIVMWLTTHGG